MSTSRPTRLCARASRMASASRPGTPGTRRDPAALQRPSRDGVGRREVGRRPGEDDVAAVPARDGTDLDHVVGGRDDGRLVLHHEDGVALLLELSQQVDQLAHVARVEPDRRLVEDVQHADEVAVELAGHLDPLALAARQAGHAAPEGEVADADVDQVAEDAPHLVHERVGDRPGDRGQPAVQLGQLQGGRLVDPQSGEPHRAGPLVEAGAGAGVALHIVEVPVVGVARARRSAVLGLVGEVALEALGRAPPRLGVGAAAMGTGDRDVVAVQEELALLRGEGRHRPVEVEEVDRHQLAPVPAAHLPVGVGQGAVAEGQRLVEQLVGVHADEGAQPGAGRTHPGRVVEAEDEGRGAVQVAAAREEHPQVGGDLGGRADGRPQRPAEALLVDHDGGRQVLDVVHVGPAELGQPTPGERAERLDELTLGLGVDRVEHQRRLARPRHAHEGDQGVPRDVERDVLQVVDARAPDPDRLRHRDPPRPSGSSGQCPPGRRHSWPVGPADRISHPSAAPGLRRPHLS